MARIDWHIQGFDVTTCNCAWGCPCQFMSLPTEGHCRAVVAFHVAHGHFGKTSLDGLSFAGLFAWPKAIHEGNGEAQPVVDVRANEAQREALLKIMSGEETEPGATYSFRAQARKACARLRKARSRDSPGLCRLTEPRADRERRLLPSDL